MHSHTNDEIVTDLFPLFRQYKCGRVERFYDPIDSVPVPPSPDDPATGVSSKDVCISSDISARLYLPKNTTPDQKLPVLVYYHGGGLILRSAFFNCEHHYLNILVSESNSIAISVDYKLAPENDVPSLYQDCWTALQWVASHADENSIINNKQQWLTDHGDFNRVFLAGDSAGGNIVYNMAMRAGRENLIGDVKLLGSILAFPYFITPIDNIEQTVPYKIWECICPPSEPGIDSPMINPIAEKSPSLSGLGCSRIFMCIGEKDELVPGEIEIQVVEALKKSGWKGELEFIEVEGEGHCFQMVHPEAEKAKDLIKKIASFIQGN